MNGVGTVQDSPVAGFVNSVMNFHARGGVLWPFGIHLSTSACYCVSNWDMSSSPKHWPLVS